MLEEQPGDRNSRGGTRQRFANVPPTSILIPPRASRIPHARPVLGCVKLVPCREGFLGRMQATITSPNKRRSQTPAPGSKVEGEGGKGGQAGAAHKAYTKASSSQERISMKRKAKREGIDTNNW